MEEKLNYYKILRSEWSKLYKDKYLLLSDDKLKKIMSLNDRISQLDVKDVYMPLVNFLGLQWKIQKAKLEMQANFLETPLLKVPLIIGIAGSVAVGKSTVARLLKTLLGEMYPKKKIQLITTDGFLYSTKVLKEKNLLDKKGFPKSYDMKKLLQFMDNVKNGIYTKVPVYSHKVYDIVPGKYEEIYDVDLLIVEGINVLQLPSKQPLFVSDYFDFSIYVDAKEEYIKKWYVERFDMLLDLAKKDKENYYYKYALGNRDEAHKMALDVWQKVNHPNLNTYILPTKKRADLVLHKSKNHLIDEIFLRKY